METPALKDCPYCKEKIREDALKCRFCREWIDSHAKPLATRGRPEDVPAKKPETDKREANRTPRPNWFARFLVVCLLFTVVKAIERNAPAALAIPEAIGFNLALIPFSMLLGVGVFSVFWGYPRLAAIENRWQRFTLCLVLGYPILFLAGLFLYERG